MDDYIDCVAGKVGGAVDWTRQLCADLGAETLRKLTDWWNGLSTPVQTFLVALGGSSWSALKKILERVIGMEAATALILIVGGVSWGLIVGALASCADLLPA